MIKLLIWGLAIYFVYRWVQKSAALKSGNTRQHFERHQQNDKADEGEYIDYEEIK